MKETGALVLLNVLIVCAYLILSGRTETKASLAVGAFGVLIGALFLFSDRLTGLKLSGIGEITAAAQQDAEAIEGIRSDVESHKDAIDLIVRDANAARDDIAKIKELAEEARLKATEMEINAQRAEEVVSELKSTADFASLILKAQNDDREAFFQLLALATQDGPFRSNAKAAVGEIVSELVLAIRIDPTTPWESWGINPTSASIQEFDSAYHQAPAIFHPAILSAVWAQEELSKRSRLQFLIEAMQTTPSLRTVNRACTILDNEAKLPTKNVLGYANFLQWWESHANEYTDD